MICRPAFVQLPSQQHSVFAFIFHQKEKMKHHTSMQSRTKISFCSQPCKVCLLLVHIYALSKHRCSYLRQRTRASTLIADTACLHPSFHGTNASDIAPADVQCTIIMTLVCPLLLILLIAAHGSEMQRSLHAVPR